MAAAPPTVKVTRRNLRQKAIWLYRDVHGKTGGYAYTHTHTPRSFAIKTLDARPWTSSLNNQVLVPPNWHSASSANGHNKLSVMQRNWETLRPRVPIYFCFTLSLSLPLSFFFCCCCYRSLSSAAYTTHFEMPSHRKKTARFFFVPSLRCSIVSRSK